MGQYTSFEYTFRDQRLYEEYCCLYSIGWEYWKAPFEYDRDCRTAREKQCVFQYCVSGEGVLVYDHQPHAIRPGQAFLIERPGHFHYYRPKESPHWEVKFLSLNLSSIGIWKDITHTFGRIVSIPPDASVLQYWDTLYALAQEDRMDNFFLSSAYAYHFMMCLYDTLYRERRPQKSEIVQTCLDRIHGQYWDELTLPALAEACDVSVSYLTRKFREAQGMSPIQYLNRHRIELACSLLLRSRIPIEKVAIQVGYKSANYFTRAFTKWMGISPREFRERECTRVVENKNLRLEVSPERVSEEPLSAFRKIQEEE